MISEEEELSRIIPVITSLSTLDTEQFSCSISIDTRKPAVAHAAILAGANFINDSSGELDKDQSMLKVAGDLGVPISTMHARGDSQTMESLTIDKLETKLCSNFDIVKYTWEWLEDRAHSGLENFNIPRWNVMLDPGLGFAKTKEQNLEILARLEEFTGLERYPVLIGASRKRFVRSMTKFDVDVATSATSIVAAISGAAMVRVHAVNHTRDALNVADLIRSKKGIRFNAKS